MLPTIAEFLLYFYKKKNFVKENHLGSPPDPGRDCSNTKTQDEISHEKRSRISLGVDEEHPSFCGLTTESDDPSEVEGGSTSPPPPPYKSMSWN